MKSIRRILTIALSFLVTWLMWMPEGKAQNWNEIFRQKRTQRKYLLQQIAALQVYIGYAKKGYEVVGSGLRTVKDITNGEFKLHEAFISSLKMVSPALRSDLRIPEILALQVGILNSFAALKRNDGLTIDQMAYIALVGVSLAKACTNDLEELLLVISSGKLEMTDHERLERLAGVYSSMLDKSDFTADFCSNVQQLVSLRRTDFGELEKIRRYHEIE
ncbi:hypothetical protein [Pedobacter sp. GR22-6]|uniref:hypothetical protein n=1 Tax=Pedobacter sp. GR22-6 TaxID=3127957 RepID=UPI00307F69D6